jgi:hypothetical protein
VLTPNGYCEVFINGNNVNFQIDPSLLPMTARFAYF